MDRRALGQFLRDAREKRHPYDFGLDAAGRRTPGLRRPEVAELAHISVDHYTNVEQARGSSPSRQVLVSISSALRLDDNEQRHLFEIAGMQAPHSIYPSMNVADSLVQLVHGMRTTAALVVSARYDVLEWNELAATLLEDFGKSGSTRRNLIRNHFLAPPGTVRYYGMSGVEEYTRLVVGQLQSAAARYPEDPQTAELIRELRAGSEEFESLWSAGYVTTGIHSMRQLHHPTLGELTLSCDLLLVPGTDQQIILLSAPNGSRTADRMARHLAETTD
ncbi:helix-turn-helix transcriptional regulator [Kribbella antibiotica]|nr:helix-turn-helix transcriptional regulator [Kribbella antibiotica]